MKLPIAFPCQLTQKAQHIALARRKMSTNRTLADTCRILCHSRPASIRRFRAATRRSYSSASPHDDIYDVVCVGGGPAGLSLLTALRANAQTSGLRVALVEAQDLANVSAFSLPRTKFSNRCSSLTPSSAHFLNMIGAWSHMKRDRVQEYHEMQVWDGITDARIQFDWSGGGGAPAGAGRPGGVIAYMIENLNITSGLLKRLRELGGVDILDNTKLEKITFGEQTDEMDLREWPIVHVAGGRSLAARLLVGADGANSPVRSFARIASRGWDYDRHGVVATLELEGDGWGGEFSKTAYQRFLPTGPVAMLPMPGKYATLVWSTTPENSALLKTLSPQDFIAMVNAAFRLSAVDLAFMHTQAAGQEEEVAWRLKHTSFDPQAIPQVVVGVQRGSIASFPLKMRHVDTYTSERIALVGDAAHTIHPLAGQGLNQGQGDVQSLVRAIEYSVTHGLDLGTHMSLESYNSERYAANNAILGVCDKLHKLYSVESGPLVSLRSIGLNAVNAISPLKNFFMEQAS